MTVSSASVSRTDGNIGFSAVSPRPPALVGCSSAGTAATATEISTPDDLKGTFGRGPLVNLGLLYLELVGPFIACRAGTASAGAAGSVTQAATGTAALGVTGAPYDAFNVIVKVTRAGATLAALTAAVKVSLDGGLTYGPEIAVPSSGVITPDDTNLTLTWTYSSGTAFVVDETYTFTCTAPTFDATTLAAALDALEVTLLDHEYVHVVGACSASLAGTVKTSIDSLVSQGIYRWFFCDARDQNLGSSESIATWQSSIQGDFASFTSDRGVVSAGACRIKDRITGARMRRSVGWAIGARLGSLSRAQGGAGPAEHPGMVATGPLQFVEVESLVHDFRIYSGLDTYRFIGAQTIPPRQAEGYFATERSMAAAGSDYSRVMHLRVIVEMERVALHAITFYVNSNQEVLASGRLTPQTAADMNAFVTAKVVAGLTRANGVPLATSIQALVNTTDNFAQTGQLRFTITGVPYGYATTVTATVGFRLNTGS